MELRLKQGVSSFFITSAGQLVTDRFGMSSAVSTWFYSGPLPETAVALKSFHPRWHFLNCDKTTITRRSDGAWDIQATYFGVQGKPEPLYTLEQTLSNEPIETHKEFATFAGTPTSPNTAHGAYFDPTDHMFVNFKQVESSPGTCTNPEWVGVRDYLSPGVTWRKISVTTTKPATGTVGKTAHPPGSPPNFGEKYNWLAMGLSYDQKALVYQVREEWRLSGSRGWNPLIYPGGA